MWCGGGGFKVTPRRYAADDGTRYSGKQPTTLLVALVPSALSTHLHSSLLPLLKARYAPCMLLRVAAPAAACTRLARRCPPRRVRVRAMAAPPARTLDEVSFLSQADAAAVDAQLMSASLGFTLDQLMELAGLSVASAVAEVYPPGAYTRVLVLVGPGTNGGDGMVAARHLHHFGYAPSVCLPKRTDKCVFSLCPTSSLATVRTACTRHRATALTPRRPRGRRSLYAGLVTQLDSLGVPFLSPAEVVASPLQGRCVAHCGRCPCSVACCLTLSSFHAASTSSSTRCSASVSAVSRGRRLTR